MDEVTMRIFRELIIHPKNSLKELENHLNLTRGQISYGLGKINDYLQPAFPNCVTRTAVKVDINGFSPCYNYSL